MSGAPRAAALSAAALGAGTATGGATRGVAFAGLVVGVAVVPAPVTFDAGLLVSPALVTGNDVTQTPNITE